MAGTTCVYVSCADDNAIAVLSLDRRTGALALRDKVAVPGAAEPSPKSLPLALNAERTRLYAALRSPPFHVAAYAIGPDGALTLLGHAPLSHSMAYISVDASGRFLYGASYDDDKFAVNAIAPDGVPGAILQVIDAPPNAHSILQEPEGTAVYAVALGGDNIMRQRIDPATGLLETPLNTIMATRLSAGPRHFIFGQGGRRLYLANEIDATVNVYARDPATGALTELQSIAMLAADALPPGQRRRMSGADIHLTPDEKFLYASERRTNVLAGFKVQPDGTLIFLERVPTETTPRGFAIDARGRFLLCAGLRSGRLGCHAIDPATGALTPVGALPVGGQPNWVEIVDL